MTRNATRGFTQHPHGSRFGVGFSLIEVIVSIAIVGIMVVATGALMWHMPVNGKEVRDQDLALKIARNEIELLRAVGYEALPPSGLFSNTLLSSLASGVAYAVITDFNAKTKLVNVRVLWVGAGHAARSVSLTTLISQYSSLK